MKKIAILVFILSAIAQIASSQTNRAIKGSIKIANSDKPLPEASICVLDARDSILVKFTRSAADGSFLIKEVPTGKLIVLVTSSEYADYVDKFTLDATEPIHDLGKIDLTLKSIVLNEVIIKGRVAPIQIKGDTTEYDSRAYVIEADSKVEDLLKQLPGIQVDRDGKIRAQGQIVNKVLVDGEEFFGDDPTLVTRNVRGDMVAKVQLYDKKSDQATFTGIDDGIRNKTLNIKLKEDKKTGYFGKVEAGMGTDEYYLAQGLFNSFKGKQKISLFVASGNNGKTGLSNEDYAKYGFDAQNQISGLISLSDLRKDDFESFDGRYNGQGMPLSTTGGVHYDNKFNKDKQSLNINFRSGFISVEGEKENLSQNNLPSRIIRTATNQDFDNSMYRNKLDMIVTTRLDSTTNLKMTIDGTVKNGNTESRYDVTSTEDDRTLYTNNRLLSGRENQTLFNAAVFLTKKFSKLGRTLSLTLQGSNNKIDTKGIIKSATTFFDDRQNETSETLDQNKLNYISGNLVNASLAYTEAITKKLSLSLNYGLSLNKVSSERNSFNIGATGNYDLFDPLVSSSFSLSQVIQDMGGVFSYKSGKSQYTLGTKLALSRYKIDDFYQKSIQHRKFNNWVPQFSYAYKFSNYESITFNYLGSTIQPTVGQVQPVFLNDDPLNITVGNPNLGPSFNNRISGGFQSYKVLTSRFFSIGGSYIIRSKPIGYDISTDAQGRTVLSAVNINKATKIYNFNIYYNRKLNNSELMGGFNFGVNGNRNYILANHILSKNSVDNITGDINISQSKAKKYSYYFSLGPGYNSLESSIQSGSTSKGFSFNVYFNFSLFLPFELELKNDGSYEYRAKTATFDNSFNRLLINTTLSKALLKERSLKISLSANDILNQNIGLSRLSYNNLIVQNSYNTIRRYFMFSISYDYSKMGKKTP